ncbi:Cellobiose dehydrogenase (cytochrome) [Penicillium ucsense]|uniref:Cellobiose dehydrogenase (Cytochrome) n=1 Tax=Penicillium ucsense TaxID=2839758 RepID=A0A8J8W9P5_9EURO|nr:Cellobiose dehydrogenase (cytochrome) [Penicillium ucsense]KAF7736500.1 Cellobiose dehydrogenase (cytochrome) [Penicillium ucsense]
MTKTLKDVSLAQMQSFRPSGIDGITYSVNIPQDTARSGSGPIYFQLKSTSQVSWFALGQGSGMSGSNIFVVYPNGNNNVTISPRLGRGQVQPLHNDAAQVSLLEGSGVKNGVITANVRCDSCINWGSGSTDLTSTSSSWIWAVKSGSPLSSKDASASIAFHDQAGSVSLDLTKATGGSSSNPFLERGNTPGPTTIVAAPQSSDNTAQKRKTAHAVLMTVAFVILFPVFALLFYLVPSPHVALIHGVLQLFTLAVAIAGMGLGIAIAGDLQLMHEAHPIIGIVVVAGLTVFQPLMGLVQHLFYRKTQKKGIFAYTHRWFGRAFIILGVINAGLGLKLGRASRGAVIAVSVVAGVMGLFYIAVLFLGQRRRTLKA